MCGCVCGGGIVCWAVPGQDPTVSGEVSTPMEEPVTTIRMCIADSVVVLIAFTAAPVPFVMDR